MKPWRPTTPATASPAPRWSSRRLTLKSLPARHARHARHLVQRLASRRIPITKPLHGWRAVEVQWRRLRCQRGSMVEQLTCNQQVRSSILLAGSTPHQKPKSRPPGSLCALPKPADPGSSSQHQHDPGSFGVLQHDPGSFGAATRPRVNPMPHDPGSTRQPMPHDPGSSCLPQHDPGSSRLPQHDPGSFVMHDPGSLGHDRCSRDVCYWLREDYGVRQEVRPAT